MVILTGSTYHNHLPEGYVRVDSLADLFELKQGKRKICKANLHFMDTVVIIYSDFSGRYYERDLRSQEEGFIRTFIQKGYVYMPEGRKSNDDALSTLKTHLLIEYYENNPDLQGCQTKLKLLRQNLKT